MLHKLSKILFLVLIFSINLSNLNSATLSDMFARGDRQSVDNDEDESGNKNTLEGVIKNIAFQFTSSKKLEEIKNKEKILITSIVELKNFTKTTEFGRVIGESLIHELSSKGYSIVEFRSQTALSVDKQGEYFMSRNLRKLNSEVENRYVLVGTYSRLRYKIIINARIIDNLDGTIIATARAIYDHGLKDDCIIFNECGPSRIIKLVPGN